jgi:hypothetical protein
LRVYEIRVLRRISGIWREEGIGKWKVFIIGIV